MKRGKVTFIFLLFITISSTVLLVQFQSKLVISSRDKDLESKNDFSSPIKDINAASDFLIGLDHNFTQIWDKISNTTNANSKNAKCVIDSKKNIHIIWEENIDGDSDILHTFYNFTSNTFGPVYNVSDVSASGYFAGNESTSADICTVVYQLL